MRRVREAKRGRWISLLVAAFIGYLLGDWHAAAVRYTGLSASQNIALRFPESGANAAAADATDEMPTGTTSDATLKEAQRALLSPQPMAPQIVAQPAPPQQTVAVASLTPTDVAAASQPLPAAMKPRAQAKTTALARPHAAPKPASAGATPQHASRSDSMLNDAQIASIKGRLHLTPDQESMWPAVEAALRNIAYAKAHYAHGRGATAGADVASLDSDSAEVQGLKSAAIPLLMSFSDEQKSEVRNLAHVMGLDKLASEF